MAALLALDAHDVDAMQSQAQCPLPPLPAARLKRLFATNWQASDPPSPPSLQPAPAAVALEKREMDKVEEEDPEDDEEEKQGGEKDWERRGWQPRYEEGLDVNEEELSSMEIE